MKYFLRMLFPLYILFLFTVAFPEENKSSTEETTSPDQIKLNIKFAPEIQERMPVGVDSIFENSLDRIYCWSSVVREYGDTIKIYHVWSYQGIEQSRVPIEITSPAFRAFTFQSILPEQTGEWTVYIVDSTNNVLGMSKFHVEPDEKTASST